MNWFREECLKQSNARENLQVQHDKLKQQFESAEEEKDFLYEQFTKQKRQNRIMKVALSKTQENCN